MAAKMYYDKDADLALSCAMGIGVTRAGVIETTFTEETETHMRYVEKVGEKLRSMMPFLDPVTIKPGQQG